MQTQPAYPPVMTSNATSIHEAIQTGLREISQPTKYILWAAFIFPIVLILLGSTLWALLIFPSGAMISVIYTMWARPRWRIRAYETVGDIHQLQRSAELAGLLRLRSHESTTGLMSHSQRKKLLSLLERFSEDEHFVDDPAFPNETHLIPRSVARQSANKPLLTLNDEGIHVASEGFFEWQVISDERIARVSYTRQLFLPAFRISAGSTALFRFEFPTGRIELPLASLRTKIWELDLLLYIYRGRFNSKNLYKIN